MMDPRRELNTLGLQFVHLIEAFRRRLACELAKYDLTMPQFVVLVSLERMGGACRIGDLAHAVWKSSAAMTGLIDRLAERGLVERRRMRRDRRSVSVVLTDAGRELIQRVKDTRYLVTEQVLGRLSPEERRNLSAILERIAQILEDAEAAEGAKSKQDPRLSETISVE